MNRLNDKDFLNLPKAEDSEQTLLYIEDDLEMSQMVCEYLGRFGFQVLTTADPRLALSLIREQKPELLLLDIMLPKTNGFELCKQIRSESQVPIIFLSARGEVTDRIVGLELGADDYLPKPFEPRELLARIHSVLRRKFVKGPRSILRCLELEMDLEKRNVSFRAQELDLTTAEFDLLKLFLTHPGQVMSRDLIQDRLRGITWDAFDRTIDVTVSRLRQKLEDDPKKPKYLKTVWGSGYLFVGEVSYVQFKS